MRTSSFVILSCEHGGNKIPKAFSPQFSKSKKALSSHRGWDPGALNIAKGLSKRLKVPLIYSEISRLLIDLNRSLGHPKLFSEFTKNLPPSERDSIIETYYLPFRNKLEHHLQRATRTKQPSLHLSIHSFTPVFEGTERNCEIGLLFDPSRLRERQFARGLADHLGLLFPDLRVRMNYPYKGTADGFTSHLRKSLPAKFYSGLEIEMNQRFLAKFERKNEVQVFIENLAWMIERTWSDLQSTANQ